MVGKNHQMTNPALGQSGKQCQNFTKDYPVPSMPFVLGPSRLRPFFRVTTVADNSLRRAGTVRAVDD